MSRQKTLAMVAVSLVGLLAVSRGVRSLVIEPYRDLQRDIARKRGEVRRYEAIIKGKWRDIERWQALGARTLSLTANEARLLFDSEIKRLLQAHGLQRESVRPKSTRAMKNGLTRVPYSVQAEGKLKNIVELLVSIYELPYVARINTLRLSPVSPKKRDVLGLHMDVETLVLPSSEMGGAVRPVALEAEDPPRSKRYEKEKGEAYAMIWQSRPFQGPKPPPRPTPVVTTATKPAQKQKVVPPSPPPPPPPPRDNSVIVALLGGPGQQKVVTVKPGRQAREVYWLGDKLGGGVLRMVHPYGAVIGIDGVDYVYPLKAALDRDDQRVPANEVPQIWKILSEVERDRPAGVPTTREASGPAQESPVAADQDEEQEGEQRRGKEATAATQPGQEAAAEKDAGQKESDEEPASEQQPSEKSSAEEPSPEKDSPAAEQGGERAAD